MENVSVSNATPPTIEELNTEERMLLLPVLVFYVIVMVVGLIGNAFVIAVYSNKLRGAGARWYILSLAALDFCVCLVGIPYHVLDLTFQYTYTFTPVCKTLSLLMGVLNYGSIFVLIVVAVDRYCKVCRTLKKQVADFGERKACGIAFGVSVLVSWPNVVLYGQSSVKTRIEGLYGIQCFFDDSYGESSYPFAFQALTLFIFVVTIIVLIVLYVFICREIFRAVRTADTNTKSGIVCCGGNDSDNDDDEDVEAENVAMETVAIGNQNNQPGQEIVANLEKENAGGDGAATATSGETRNESTYKRLKDDKVNKSAKGTTKSKKKSEKSQKTVALTRHRAPGTSKKKEEKQRRKITLMMFTITVVFIVSYLPYLAMVLADSLDDELWDNISLFESLIFEICLRTYLFNNVANPIIYGFWDKRFRRECVLLIRKLFCCPDVKDAGRGKNSAPMSSQQTFTSHQTKTSMV